MFLEVFSSGPMWRLSGRPFVAICSIVLADLKLVGRLAIVELGLPSFLATWFGPPVQAVESLPPPIRGPTARLVAAAAAAAGAAAAVAADAAHVLILRVARDCLLLLFY